MADWTFPVICYLFKRSAGGNSTVRVSYRWIVFPCTNSASVFRQILQFLFFSSILHQYLYVWGNPYFVNPNYQILRVGLHLKQRSITPTFLLHRCQRTLLISRRSKFGGNLPDDRHYSESHPPIYQELRRSCAPLCIRS